eukprot:6189087-Ditylum_brightwellii.AAC.1
MQQLPWAPTNFCLLLVRQMKVLLHLRIYFKEKRTATHQVYCDVKQLEEIIAVTVVNDDGIYSKMLIVFLDH